MEKFATPVHLLIRERERIISSIRDGFAKIYTPNRGELILLDVLGDDINDLSRDVTMFLEYDINHVQQQ